MGRRFSREGARKLRPVWGSAFVFLTMLAAAPVGAQELSFGFTNPSFGGNPFYSDHLLSIATAQRPERPTASSTELSQTELFARQLQSRLLSSLTTGITQAITGSEAGDSGEFVLGDQRITFVNTGTELRVTIFNEITGETTEIVVPVFNFANGGGTPVTPPVTPRSASAEAVIIGAPSGTDISTIGNSGSLDSAPVEHPLGKLPL